MAGRGFRERRLTESGANATQHHTSYVAPITWIAEAGVVHLEGLTNLWAIYLASPQITKAGLVSLKEMSKLETLALGGC